jgi:hypothetical protein
MFKPAPLIVAAMLASSATTAYATCKCDCVSGGSIIYSHNNNNAQECQSACAFDSSVYGSPLTASGQCMSGGAATDPMTTLPKKASDGPPVGFCVPVAKATAEGWVRDLFGEQTGSVPSCIVTRSRISKVYCYMAPGESSSAPATPNAKLGLPGCASKFDDNSSCSIGWGTPRGYLPTPLPRSAISESMCSWNGLICSA